MFHSVVDHSGDYQRSFPSQESSGQFNLCCGSKPAWMICKEKSDGVRAEERTLEGMRAEMPGSGKLRIE